MKKIFLGLFWSVLWSIQLAFSQPEHPFQHEGAIWSQFMGDWIFFPGQSYLLGGTHFLHATGDTAINGFNYIKINAGDSLTSGSRYLYAIREDSSGNVWWYDANHSMDVML